MLNYFEERKETFFTTKNRISQSPKNRFFFEGVNPCFWPKHANFLNLNLIKISLEIMLSDFAEKKETFLTLKNRLFQTPKNRTFSKGLIHIFAPQNAIFLLILIRIK